MVRDSYYSDVSVRPYRRDGKQVGWRGSISYYDAAEKDAHGKPKRRQVTKTTTTQGKRAATAELRKWREKMEETARKLGRIPAKSRKGDELTVVDAVGNYLDAQLAQGKIEKSTYANQRNSLNNYIAHYEIGSLIFKDVDGVHLEKWLTDLHKKGLGTNTIHSAWSVLYKTYRYYFKTRQINVNPCDYVSSPKKGDAKVTYLDDEQVVYLLKCRDKHYEKGSPMWTALGLALYGGLRREEICGLRWQDVDFEAGALTISSAIGVAKDSDGKQFNYTKEPKNKTSKRAFPLIPALRKTLKARYDNVEAVYGTVQRSWFVIGQAVKYMPPTTLSTEMRRFTREYDIREHYGKYVTLHALRHNFATTGVNKTTMDIASLSQVMGHASKSMTLDTYSSATKDAVEIAMKKLGEAMNYEES